MDGLEAVLGFADNLQVFLKRQDGREAGASDAEAVRTFGTLYAATLNPTEQEGEVRLVTETMKRYSKAAPAVPAEDSELLELDE